MIPENITKQHIVQAIADVDRNGIPPGRNSTKYSLRHGNRLYPPKYLISIANRFANGHELSPPLFSGGREVNDFLTRRGFSIEGGPLRPHSKKPHCARVVSSGHNERCSECKNALIEMFRNIYGSVRVDHKIEVPAGIDGYASHPRRSDLVRILRALQTHRGHQEFVRLKHLHRCDLYIPSIDAIVEFDESQHFTAAREVTLEHYPADLPLGFSLREWRDRCREIGAKDNDPAFRDEQRAWYDCLRDFLPLTKGMSATIRIYMGGYRWCSLDSRSPADITAFKKMFSPPLPVPPCSNEVGVQETPVAATSGDEHARHAGVGILCKVARRAGAAIKKVLLPSHPVPSPAETTGVLVATAVIGSEGQYTNDSRFQLMLAVLREAEADAVLFAAGYFTTQDRPYKLVSGLTKQVSMLVRNMKRKPVVCFGVDGRVNGKYSKDQLAVAVGANGVLGLARKFHPTAAESGHIEVATGPLAGERNYPRMIDIMGRRAFMAVCYDGFGIRQCRLANPGVDMIFDLIHGFSPKGEAASGDVYFAKHALAGSSKQWRCPAFGAAVFFRRPVSTKWPSGVIWNQGSTSTQRWKYSDNSLHALCESQVSDGSEKALVRVYRV